MNPDTDAQMTEFLGKLTPDGKPNMEMARSAARSTVRRAVEMIAGHPIGLSDVVEPEILVLSGRDHLTSD